MRKWLDGNWIFMYSTHNKGKSVVPERFTRISKAKICKKTTANNSKSWMF